MSRDLFSREAWERNAAIYETIRTMPFNAQLASGLLSEARFKHYITQDAHYLIGFGRALTLAAAKPPPRPPYRFARVCMLPSRGLPSSSGYSGIPLSGWRLGQYRRWLRGDPDRYHYRIEMIHVLGAVGHRGLVAAHPKPQRVQHRHDEQRQHGRNEQSAHDRDRHGPPEDAARQWDHAESRGQRREHHGTRPPHGRIDDRAMAAMPGADVAVDLIDQDDSIAHDHAGKRDQPEQCHEAERPVGDEQRAGRPDQPERGGREYQRQPRETLQLDHQERQRHDGHDREHGDQSTVRLDTFLDRSTSLDAIAVGQGVLDVLELRLHLLADVRRLHAVDDVAACGQHDVAVAAPQDRLFIFIVEARDLRQRYGDAVAADDGERRQTVELQSFGRDRARHHVDVLDAFTVLRDDVTRQ